MRDEIIFHPKGVSSSICKVGGRTEVNEQSLFLGLIQLNLLDERCSIIRFEDLSPWVRGGSETYIAECKLVFEKENVTSERHIIAKAILSMVDVDSRWNQYLRRIKRLNEYGVKTPLNFGYAEGVIYQEFIPFSFAEFYQSANPAVKDGLRQELRQMARLVDDAGFSTTGFVHNIRTDGEKLYIVDFGSDLGDFVENRVSKLGSAEQNVVNWLSNH